MRGARRTDNVITKCYTNLKEVFYACFRPSRSQARYSQHPY